MKKSLILMFILSLLGHIAAAGMLYVAGAYGVWDKPPRYGTDDQREYEVRVLWGFAEETQMPLRGAKGQGNNPPYSPPLEKGGKGGFDWGMSPDESLRSGLKSSAEESMPVAHSERNEDGSHGLEAIVTPALQPELEEDDSDSRGQLIVEDKSSRDEDTIRSLGLYAYHPVPAEETGPRSTGLYNRHSDVAADGVVMEEGNAQPSGGDSDSSVPSMMDMGSDSECGRPDVCTDTDVASSGVYTGIDEAGSRGRGGQGEGLKTFLEMIRIEIERHKNYPPFARKNGIEGTAYLNFHIGDNGRPDGIIIERSSGSKILDESAIRTLKGMERFYPVPEEIRDLEITVPIAYRLVEDTDKINR